MARFIVALLIFAAACSCLHQKGFNEERWRKATRSTDPALLYAPNKKNDTFYNPWLPMEKRGFGELLRWKISRKATYSEHERNFLPKFIPGLKERVQSMGPGDFIAWIGHGTFLIRVDGQYWLTDPIFTDRALLPKRRTPPALSLADLRDLAPEINVIISHNHYDHLDRKSVMQLPPSARFFVPPGLADYLKSLGRSRVTELDWWQSFDGPGFHLVCLPAQHWSRRFRQATDSTLWASFLLITPSTRIYFGGDSGYFVGYKEIGKRYPGIEYALMPTTAYHPRWFMHYAHMDTAENLEAFRDLGAEYFIPTQWGAFELGDEPAGYPALDLKRSIQTKNIDPSRYIVMDLGQVLPISPSVNKPETRSPGKNSKK
jgi:L-ascorbate metabolism protein UlaG (beta-lactamase superfamily)